MAYELNAPYSDLILQYQPMSDRLTQDAMNRARQIGAQSAAARGGGIARGTPLNTYNRLMSDYNLQRDREEMNRQLAVQAGNTRVMATPQAVTPTWQTQALQSLGGLAGNVVGTFGGQLAKGMADKALGTWGMSAPQAVQQLESLRAGPGSGFGGWEGSYGSVMPPASGPDVAGMAAQEYSPFSSLIEPTVEGFPSIATESLTNPWWGESTSNLFNLFSGGGWAGI